MVIHNTDSAANFLFLRKLKARKEVHNFVIHVITIRSKKEDID